MEIRKQGIVKFISCGIILLMGILFSQTAFSQPNINGTNLTVLAAEFSQIPPIAAEAIPITATFYSAQNPSAPPFPGNIYSLPAWSIGTNMYLLDDLDFDYQAQFQMSGSTTAGRALAFDDTSSPAPFTVPTNGLWLQITNVANGLAYVNLNNATNSVYEILTKTDLTLTNWNIEMEVWPTNATVMPFVVQQQGRTNLFVWARDWTGETENGNTTPDWWFWEYFGTVALCDNNLDSRGNTLLFDYQNGLDPNTISFSLSVTNNYAKNMSVPVSLNITSGAPSYAAVSVDDTNYQADADW